MAPPRTGALHESQRHHIATVMQVAAGPGAAMAAVAHDAVIQQSWQRCVHEHRLDPTRLQEAVILPDARVREHQDQMEDFLHIARHGLETLYQQVAGLGYVVLLTDARGVTVDFLGDLALDGSLRRAGLYLGADWSEHHAGTCAVGTCIRNGEALVVHQADHFDATHIPLTCSAAPVFDAQGRMSAVLDISALSSPQAKSSQHLALQLVRVYAAHVENASFLQRHRGHWILRLSAAPQFLDVNPEHLIALDDGGRIVGLNRRAQLLLGGAGTGRGLDSSWTATPGSSGHGGAAGPNAASLAAAAAATTAALPLGRRFDELFHARFEDLGHYVAGRPSDQRAIGVVGRAQLLFLLASPPPTRTDATPARRHVAEPRALPAPLAALSGGDPALDRQIERAARLVNSPIHLLLTGETGSGKEHFAKALHAASERRRQPFVAVNCAAIPETLIESELFGHLPGSFSGAGSKGKRGLIQASDGGTLFLDEIGDMPLALQARLLRVLAEREVLPVGATRPQPVNLRVISATHRPLEELVHAGRFRDDLFYRLNGAHLLMPPLRERADLDWLVRRLLADGLPPGQAAPALADDALARLRAHDWPGNLRELRNVLEYARAVCGPGGITVADLPEGILARTPRRGTSSTSPSASATVAGSTGTDGARAGTSVEVAAAAGRAAHDALALRQTLSELRWNVTAAARRLGVSRMTLYRRMKRHGITSPNQSDTTSA